MKISNIKNKKHLTLPFTTFTNFLTMITINTTIIRITAIKFQTTPWEKLMLISSTRPHRWLGPNLNIPATVATTRFIPVTVFFFSHLRLNCGRFNVNDKFFHKKTIAMVINETPPNVISLPVIIFSATVVKSTGYAFKNWHYAVLQMHWEIDCFKPTDIYINNVFTMFMINRIYFRVLPTWKNVKIRCMVYKIPIRGIGTQIHYSDEFAILTFYLKKSKTVTAIIRKLYIVDDLKTKMLLNTDIMSPEKMNFDFGSQQIIIGNCKNLLIFFSSHARKQPNFKRTVRFKFSSVLSPNVTTNIPVNYHGQIIVDRDFLFESRFNQHLGNDGGVYAHIVDEFFNFVQIHNVTASPVTIPRRIKLKSIIEYNQKGCYLIDFNTDPKLTITGWRNKTIKVVKFAIMAAAFFVSFSQFQMVFTSLKQLPRSISMTPVFIAIDFSHEFTFPCGVTVYGGLPKNDGAHLIFTKMVNVYFNVWFDSGRVIKVPQDQ